MFSLRRQWHRFQLARDLLEQYEYEEAHRISWPEAMRRLEEFGRLPVLSPRDTAARWAKATRVKAEQYPSDA